MVEEVVAQSLKVSAMNLIKNLSHIRGDDLLKLIFARIKKSPIECKLISANNF